MPMEISIPAVLEAAQNLTIISGLILVLIGGKRRWWVWGYQLTEMRADLKEQLADERAEKEEWKQLALRNIEVAKTLLRAGSPS